MPVDDAGGSDYAATPAALSSAPQWVKIAYGELGVRETPGPKSTPRVDSYLKTVGLSRDDTPWCAAFVQWSLSKAGLPGTGAANARSYLNWGRDCKPKVGAVCVLARGNSSWQGHVGFVISFTTDTVTLLGGNQGDKVSVQVFPRAKVLGFRWPRSVADSNTMKATVVTLASSAPVLSSPLVAAAAAGLIDEPSRVENINTLLRSLVTGPVGMILGAVALCGVAYLIYGTVRRVRTRG